MKYDVFVSYNRRDTLVVDALVALLRAESVSVWKDSDQLIAGTPLLASIEQGVRASRNVLVCVGASGVGDWQDPEIQAALTLSLDDPSIRVIPVLVPGAPAELTLPLFLRSNLWVDLRGGLNDPANWSLLRRSIQAPSSAPAAPANTAESAEPGVRGAASLALIRDGAVLLVKRAATAKLGAGNWQFPGGKIDPGETPLAAAVREAREEVGFGVEPDAATFICELRDAWPDRRSGKTVRMSLFWAPAPAGDVVLESTFDAYAWVPLSEAFEQRDKVLFGSTGRLLRVLRRYFDAYLPLLRLADVLQQSVDSHAPLPHAPALGGGAGETVYGVLSLLGLVDDRGSYRAASPFAAPTLRVLAAAALTESSVFAAEGKGEWYADAVHRGARDEVDKLRRQLFDRHASLLGLLSYRVMVPSSERRIAALLVGATDETGCRYLLVRWDFKARKFQLPARGLEEVDDPDVTSPDSARYVVAERLDRSLVQAVGCRYLGRLETRHVGAGSMNDGPLMRRYDIGVFELEVLGAAQHATLQCLRRHNQHTEALLQDLSADELGEHPTSLYYMWADLDEILRNPTVLLGRPMQGFREIIEELRPQVLTSVRNPIAINSAASPIPVVSPRLRDTRLPEWFTDDG
ncbi:NUDIX domain-containing protein [Longimicrobium sp.]|uniref:NUDIX domain-containing protein n=1 Tax=Longimicrobium sp. TaxID=2029185 RepID=UPI003B3A0F93